MVGDPVWMLGHAGLVLGVTVLIVTGKAVLVTAAALVAARPLKTAVPTGLCLAQVGEFSFLLLTVGLGNGVLPEETYRLLVSAAILSLFVTPFLIALAPWVAGRLGAPSRAGGDEKERSGHVVVVGYGPAGEAAAAAVAAREIPVVVLDLEPVNVEKARSHGHAGEVGDGTSSEVLAHVGLTGALAIAITLPDPRLAQEAVIAARTLAPGLPVVARSRYRRHCVDLSRAGASTVDEEGHVGKEIGRQVLGDPD
jgi:CPA2 family monovalent cation:H+ antiporter-2